MTITKELDKHFTKQAYKAIQDTPDSLLFVPYKYQIDMMKARLAKCVAYNCIRHNKAITR